MLKTTKQFQISFKRPQSLESGPIKRTLIADILDIHNPSKRVLCIRITDDLRFVEIVQINIYVQP